MKLTGKRFLVLLLYAPTDSMDFNVPIRGRTRLMKMGFLFDRELKNKFITDKTFDSIELPEFFAWYYGPFSKDLLNDLEFLINQKYVLVDNPRTKPLPEETAEYEFWIKDLNEFEQEEYETELFSLTEERGIPKGCDLWAYISQNQKDLLSNFKNSLVEAPLSRIIEYVYRKYKADGVTYKSLIKHKYL